MISLRSIIGSLKSLSRRVDSARAVRPLRLRVLVAEDHGMFADWLLRVLTRAGFEVDLARDGLAALKAMEGKSLAYDALVTDYNMPAMDGAELARRLRAAGFQGAIVVFSSGELPSLQEAFHGTGVTAIVCKNASASDELIATLRTVNPRHGKR